MNLSEYIGTKNFNCQAGLLIAVHREKAGLTQEQLAKKCGMKQAQIARMESCFHKMSLESFQRAIRATGAKKVIFYINF